MSTNGKQWVTVFASINMTHAEMVRGILESHGVSARTIDRHAGSLQIGMSVAMGGIKVQVEQERAAEAAELLTQLEMHEVQGSAERKLGKFWVYNALFLGGALAAILAIWLVSQFIK